ncbi:MAG: hypothetical protein AAF393_03185 [Pseudomonadota bacterium]
MNFRNGIAKILAVFLLSPLASMAEERDLTLPQGSADPVILNDAEKGPDDQILKVTVRGAETPIAGRYLRMGATLSFTPAFGFEPGQNYVAHFLAQGEKKQVAFQIENQRAAVPAAVTDIYPSGDTLPENTLRFYVHFSTPMQPQVAFDYISLVDATGAVDEAAFMRFKQELWNEDRTRLTVLIDPGRIKREVATNVELGPALVAGQRYKLNIAGGWPSADGKTVLPAFAKSFQVSEALRTLPETSGWTANAPCAGTRESLIIAFDRPFDRHLLTRALRVETNKNGRVEGTVTINEGEHNWAFKPLAPWPDKDLQLIVDPDLEDVAGNNFRDLLDQMAGDQKSDTAVPFLTIRVQTCQE